VREVIADLGVRLSARDLLAAQAHVSLPREMILDPLCGVLQLRVGARLKIRDYVGRVSIARDHRGVVGFVEADDPRDVRLEAELAGDLLNAPLDCPCSNVTGVHDRHDPRVDLAPGHRLEPIRGLDRLCCRVVGAVRAHVLRDAEAERASERCADHRDQEHAAPVCVKKRGEVVEHCLLPLL
jgi:hypothetical protein